MVAKYPGKHRLIVSGNTAFSDIFLSIDPKNTKTYVLNQNKADLMAEELLLNPEKSSFILKDRKNARKFPAELSVPGTYNVENALASCLVAEFLGFSYEQIVPHLQNLQAVPGRLQRVKVPAPCQVFIDFAITPGALTQVLQYLKIISKGRVIAVFGCTGGNHDHQKRSMMGQVSASLADLVILTEDETYGEDNNQILADIQKGFPLGFQNYRVVPDRGDAIFAALQEAKAGDTVLITGMGSFQSRNNGQTEVPWSDLQWVNDYYK